MLLYEIRIQNLFLSTLKSDFDFQLAFMLRRGIATLLLKFDM